MEKIKCIICNSQEYTHYLDVKDRFNKEKIFNLVKCNCGFIYLNPRPIESDIDKFYNNFDYDPHNIDESSFFSKVYNFVKKYAFTRKFKLINKFYKNTGIHLDIGGGMGDFCFYMQQHGWVSINQDTSMQALDVSRSKYIKSIFSIDSKIKSTSIDLVTAWHSIEHIHNIDKIFLEIQRVLKPQKYFFLCVPNSDSFEQKYYKEQWVAWDAPRHLYHFTPNLIKQYVEKYNFEVIYYETLFQDTPYNIFLSIKGENIFRYFKALFILLGSYFSIIFYGYKKSSSFLVICRKK